MTSLSSMNIETLSKHRELISHKRKNETQITNHIKQMIFISTCVEEMLSFIGEFPEDMKKMMMTSCQRIILSFAKKYKVRKNLLLTICISTVWLVIKAYAVDEEEDNQWIDAIYMSNFSESSSPDQIIKYERLIFKHLNYEVYSPEKKSSLNPYNKIDFTK